MKPAVYNFSLARGSTDPFTFALRTRVGSVYTNIPFENVVMTIGNDDPDDDVPILTLSLTNGRLIVSDALTAQITWTPTEAESRSIPHGPHARYEVEVRNGTGRIIYLMGIITGLGGLNSDAVSP